MRSVISFRSVWLFVLPFFYLMSPSAFGQDVPSILTRFANPHLDQKSGKFYLDVELSSGMSTELLFGMNLRFFYDASVLAFEKAEQFHEGYGLLGKSIEALTGHENGATALFGYEGLYGYVNGSIYLVQPAMAMKLGPHTWNKLVRLSFVLRENLPSGKVFCPPVVWDKKPHQDQESYIQGSEGLVVTVVNTDRSLRQKSRSTRVETIPFNWVFDHQPESTHGRPNSGYCFSSGISTLLPDVFTQVERENDYRVYQNQPNPVTDYTIIEFTAPASREVTFVFFDLEGRILERITGHFIAGQNQLVLKARPWMSAQQMVFYWLEAEGYRSEVMTMMMARS